jgi:hypothetical protein
MAVFMEKSTPKNSRNASVPPSQTPKDDETASQPGTQSKGREQDQQRARHRCRTQEGQVGQGALGAICG